MKTAVPVDVPEGSEESAAYLPRLVPSYATSVSVDILEEKEARISDLKAQVEELRGRLAVDQREREELRQLLKQAQQLALANAMVKALPAPDETIVEEKKRSEESSPILASGLKARMKIKIGGDGCSINTEGSRESFGMKKRRMALMGVSQ